jgi:hypothetical protein
MDIDLMQSDMTALGIAQVMAQNTEKYVLDRMPDVKTKLKKSSFALTFPEDPSFSVSVSTHGVIEKNASFCTSVSAHGVEEKINTHWVYETLQSVNQEPCGRFQTTEDLVDYLIALRATRNVSQKCNDDDDDSSSKSAVGSATHNETVDVKSTVGQSKTKQGEDEDVKATRDFSMPIRHNSTTTSKATDYPIRDTLLYLKLYASDASIVIVDNGVLLFFPEMPKNPLRLFAYGEGKASEANYWRQWDVLGKRFSNPNHMGEYLMVIRAQMLGHDVHLNADVDGDEDYKTDTKSHSFSSSSSSSRVDVDSDSDIEENIPLMSASSSSSSSALALPVSASSNNVPRLSESEMRRRRSKHRRYNKNRKMNRRHK